MTTFQVGDAVRVDKGVRRFGGQAGFVVMVNETGGPAPYTNGRIICILDKPNVRTGEPHRGPHWGPDERGRYVQWRDRS